MRDDNVSVDLPIPLPDTHVFRYQAMDDLLELLVRNPHQSFPVTQLRTVTGHGGKTVNNALELLDALDLIIVETRSKTRLIRINRERLRKPDDPLLAIPQEGFRDPVRAFLTAVEDSDIAPVGVLLFGSVARGEADRASDIDILLVVADEAVQARREAQDARQAVESQTFDGDRYEFQVLVESIEAAQQYGSKLHEIFSEAIVLEDSEALQQAKRSVFSAE